MELVLFRNKWEKRKLVFFVSFIIVLCSLVTAAVLISAARIKRVQVVLEKTLSGAPVSRKDAVELGTAGEKTLQAVFEAFEPSELLAASLLLENQGFSNSADLLLYRVSEGVGILAEMSRSLLAESLGEKKKWPDLARFSSAYVNCPQDGKQWLNTALMALFQSGEFPDEGFLSSSADVLWAIPYLEKSGNLNKEYLVEILLSASAGEIFDLFNSWNSPLKENEDIQNLLELKNALEGRDYDRAEPLLRELWDGVLSTLPSLPENFLLTLRDMLRQDRFASFWVDILNDTRLGEQSSAGAFLLGSLQEQAGDTASALSSYSLARNENASFEQSRRALWYEMRILIRHSPERMVSFLSENAADWGSTSYFDDLMDEYYSYLIRRRLWETLAEAVEILSSTELREPVAQGVFLLNQAVIDGKIERPGFLTPLFVSENLDRDSLGYYNMVSSPDKWPFSPLKGSRENQRLPLLPPEDGAVEDVYRIILQAGQIELGWALWNKRHDPLGPDVVEMFSNRLFRMQEFYRCIQFSGYWYYRWPSETAVNLIPWLYPQDQNLPVEVYARKYGIPEELILGIIRRESAFHQTIESRSGAVGLMQLMPATASDLAGRYRMEGWSLKDPGDNIRLGSLYVNWLKERDWTSNYAEILAAYNGGGGNLRRWKRSYGDLNMQLFIQSIPYRETRNYVRKVIVAAGTYRYLNTGNPPAEWLDLFFNPFK